MSSGYRRGKHGSKERKWRWTDKTTNQLLPQSWADNGRIESADDDEVKLYAIQWRAGLLLEWVVDTRTGTLLEGPLSEQPGIRVLYVTADGEQALVQEWEARETEGNWKPPKEFVSIVATHPDEIDAVQDSTQDYYCRSVEGLYNL
ncbi:hypothetical protein Har1131_18735 [Haloarcula sp. CBA1131]|uniref:hypothetical protein n=1 Tax=Haloarcula sp. CBA1131 TaxID=1853686 RepID=UPI00124758D7|nr:hypothetical protein [Haloarcula sp. CBA1131]KAA9400714.1 hypothetical protein Har1131_18735 [Haloarcula sp. CBA1131]